jgi:hypothetical protein
MIPIPSGVRVWLATGATDMRRGMNGLALQVQQALQRDPHMGDIYCFRGKRGDLLKIFRHVALCEAVGTRTVHLANADRRRRCDYRGAARLYAGRNRLEEPATNVATRTGWRISLVGASFF